MIHHPIKPSLNGKNLMELKDPDNKLFFKESDSVAAASEQMTATIEAARAGEAGKGFAVVANEIVSTIAAAVGCPR